MRSKWINDDGEPIDSSRATWLDFLVLGTTVLSNLTETASRGIDSFRVLIQQHYNWQVDQEDFYSEVAQTIETLPGGENG